MLATPISNKKRVLKKVRPQFLYKQTDSELTEIDPATKFLSHNQPYVLNPILGLVEKDRKLYLGPEHLNCCFQISESKIQEQLNCKAITLYLQKKEAITNMIPWEYATKRLESYGDLELAVWAQRIKKYYDNHPKLMEKYFELVYSENRQFYEEMIETDKKVASACEEIEKNLQYYKIVHFLGRESIELDSLCYNEGFLNEIGYTMESFTKSIRKNGIPALFESSCSLYLDMMKKYFDDSIKTAGPITEGPEFIAPIVGEDGKTREVSGQFINFFRPACDGYFTYCYLILRKKNSEEMEIKNSCKSVKKVDYEEEKLL